MKRTNGDEDDDEERVGDGAITITIPIKRRIKRETGRGVDCGEG